MTTKAMEFETFSDTRQKTKMELPGKNYRLIMYQSIPSVTIPRANFQKLSNPDRQGSFCVKSQGGRLLWDPRF